MSLRYNWNSQHMNNKYSQSRFPNFPSPHLQSTCCSIELLPLLLSPVTWLGGMVDLAGEPCRASKPEVTRHLYILAVGCPRNRSVSASQVCSLLFNDRLILFPCQLVAWDAITKKSLSEPPEPPQAPPASGPGSIPLPSCLALRAGHPLFSGMPAHLLPWNGTCPGVTEHQSGQCLPRPGSGRAGCYSPLR